MAMEVLGIDEAELQQQVITALIGCGVIFFVIAPIMGRFLHLWVAHHLPEHSVLVLVGLAMIVFLMSFAIVLGILLRWGSALQLGLEISLLISLISGLLAVGVMALAVRITIQRTTPTTSRETSEVRSGAWGVWGEDARTRNKNLRNRKR
jgi:hypothetical protein